MNTGTYISGAVHIGLIGWLLVGDVFRSEPAAPEITNVSVISAAEFNAAIVSSDQPEVEVDLAQLPTPPVEDVLEDLPDPAQDEAPELTDLSDPELPQQPETAPDLSALLTTPDAEVSFDTPTLAPPSFDVGPDIRIDDSPDNNPREAPRVAPVPFLRPDQDVAVDQSVTEAAAEAEAPEQDIIEEEQDAAAPEEATTEIVTEAETPSGAPTSVPVPRFRPQPNTDLATPEPAPEPPAPDTDAAVAAALADLTDEPELADPALPVGPPMSFAEKESLRVAVSNCWNTGSMSSAALRVTVVVGVQMEESGRPIQSSVTLLSSTGGEGEAVQQAFAAARRAILRCGARGYDLPQDKFAQWRDIEMTFNPENMRIK